MDGDPDVEDEVLQDKEKGGYPRGGYHLTLVLVAMGSVVAGVPTPLGQLASND